VGAAAITTLPSSGSASASASSSEEATSTPSAVQVGERVSTIVVRPGSGRPMESYVARPITSVWPRVTRLKCAKSSGIRHGMSPSAPITPLDATAATMTIRLVIRRWAP
jgi:hypothetical protein